jgi:DNA-directed RNA polymerase beta subunit
MDDLMDMIDDAASVYEYDMNDDDNNDEINQEEVWFVIDKYFEEHGLVSQQLDSFDEFVSSTIQELIDDNPSLKPYLEEALTQAYIKGLLLAVSETNLPDRTFPKNCPYSLTEILSDRFYPGQPNNLTEE